MNTIEQSKRQYSKDDLQLRLETEYHMTLLLSYILDIQARYSPTVLKVPLNSNQSIILDTQLLLANTKAENDKK